MKTKRAVVALVAACMTLLGPGVAQATTTQSSNTLVIIGAQPARLVPVLRTVLVPMNRIVWVRTFRGMVPVSQVVFVPTVRTVLVPVR